MVFLLENTQYLVVGGGLAGGSAVEAIRVRDHEGRIVLVSDERHLPYDRVPLSKGYLLGKVPRDSLFLQENDFYQQQHVEAWLGRHVDELDPDTQTAILDDGREIEYENLLLTTGGNPRRLPIPGSDLQGIHYLRTIEDSEAIQAAMLKAHRAVVIGGGFIGCEIAAACAQKGIDATIIETGSAVLNTALDQETAGWIKQYLIENRVHVLTNQAATHFIQANGRVAGVETKTGEQVLGDFVAVGIGIKPNVELAQAAGLPVDNGIIVNEQLQVDGTRIYAAGDVARFYSPVFDKHLRLEHYDVAVEHGQIAGANMTGGKERFAELPHFFSFMFKLRTELWGDATQRELVVRRGPLQLSDMGGFAQFYLTQGRIQAYLSVNRPTKESEAAQRLILSRQIIENPSVLSNESIDLNTLVS